MHSTAERITKTTFEYVYDTYSPILNAIALQISPNKNIAEQILISTFVKVNEQKLYLKNYPSLCVILIKLIIQTGNECFKLKNNIRLEQFEDSPLIHQLLCKCLTMEKLCEQNVLTRIQAAKKIREEILLLRHKPAKAIVPFQNP